MGAPHEMHQIRGSDGVWRSCYCGDPLSHRDTSEPPPSPSWQSAARAAGWVSAEKWKALKEEYDRTEAEAAALRDALGPLWTFLLREHGDWYMKAERRVHANRADAALSSSAGLSLLALRDAVAQLRALKDGSRYQMPDWQAALADLFAKLGACK